MQELTVSLDLWQMVALALISFLVGLLGGFVGLALGTMRLPAIILTGMDPQIAAGTNILVSALAALAGGYQHLREGRVDRSVVLWLGIPSITGAFVGGLFGGLAPAGLLILIVGLLVMWQGVEVLSLSRRLRSRCKPELGPEIKTLGSHSVRSKVTVGGSIGLLIGLLGGAVGLILGSLRIPLMVRLMNMNPRMAAGSNLVIGASLGLFGFVGHGIRGEVDLPILLAMSSTGMVGANIGARYTGRADTGFLVLVLSVVLWVVGIILVTQGAWKGLY